MHDEEVSFVITGKNKLYWARVNPVLDLRTMWIPTPRHLNNHLHCHLNLRFSSFFLLINFFLSCGIYVCLFVCVTDCLFWPTAFWQISLLDGSECILLCDNFYFARSFVCLSVCLFVCLFWSTSHRLEVGTGQTCEKLFRAFFCLGLGRRGRRVGGTLLCGRPRLTHTPTRTCLLC